MTYAATAIMARRLIAAKGAPGTLRRDTVTLDPLTGAGGAASSLADVQAVGLPPGRSAEARVGTLVGRNVMQFTMAGGADVDARPGDLLEWGGRTWTLIWVSRLAPDGGDAVILEAYGEIAP